VDDASACHPALAAKLSLLSAAALLATLIAAPAQADSLRVCADPSYLPFSDRAGQGFENAVAEAVAKHLGDTVEYTWHSYHIDGGFEAFLAATLGADRCDLVMTVPYGSSGVTTTDPYYVSSYVFVFQRDKGYALSNMEAPLLRELKLGYQRHSLPEAGLRARGLAANATAFDFSDQRQSPRMMLAAVQDGSVDVIVAWEPAVGTFLPDYPDLKAVPVSNAWSRGFPERYSFPISMALRPDATALARRINAVIDDHGAELRTILERHGVRFYRVEEEPEFLTPCASCAP